MSAKHIIAVGLALLPAITGAAETVTYSYDAKGRLTKVQHTGGRNNGMISNYAFDAADNRTASKVAGARARMIVVPLGGLRPIPTG